ncbi:DUF1566 domain-containing protein [Ferrimonas kyonanensis]|uniref:Lcl domain-containing protein n=1 Tax=Ferrimonas kyonanensis TaxID=364763 RepID=UPI00041D64C9|nr:DUF1566 domain-containing protein [Ferrimonas kyonanensis]
MKQTLLCMAISVALVGCGGSGGSGGSDNQAPTYSVSGEVTSNNVAQQAQVCADLNQNFRCDSGEPASTASSGSFTLTSTDKNILTSPLVAAFDNDVAGAAAKASLVAPARKLETGNDINAITTVIAGLISTGVTLEQATELVVNEIQRLGVPVPAALLDNSDDAGLATVDANLVGLLKQLNDNNRETVLASLGLTLAVAPSLAQASSDNGEITALIAQLEQLETETVALNDTGVYRYFSDSSASEDVIEPQPDYPGQDAEHGLDASDPQGQSKAGFKLVKLDKDGNELAADASEWRCVLDKRSGLMWEVKSDVSSDLQYKDRLFALQIDGHFSPYADDLAEAGCQQAGDSICTTADYAKQLSTDQLCGSDRWRLPTGNEFYNLLNLGVTETNSNDDVMALSTALFPHQSLGSPDVEQGSVWTNSLSYNAYSAYQTDGSVQYNLVSSMGSYRGYIETIELYTSDSAADQGYSYLFPTRLVATKD